MNTFDEIIDSLEFIGKYAEGYGNFGLNVTFEIGLSKDNTENNPLEFPLYKVIVKRNDKNDISGYELTISFLSDGENDSEIYKKCNEIKNYEFSSSLKFDSINGCELQASLGNDLNVAATIIQYYILMQTKTRNFFLKSSYSFSFLPSGDLSTLVRQQHILPFPAVKNVLSVLFKYAQYQDSLYFDILEMRGYGTARDLIGNVLIMKNDASGDYIAYFRMEEIAKNNLEDSLLRFRDNKGKYSVSYIGLSSNKWDARLKFTIDQMESLVYFISDFFTMVYPNLTDEKVIVSIPYYDNNPPTINLNLFFYPDGKGPSEEELKFASQIYCLGYT